VLGYLPQWLTELKKTIYLLKYQCIIKDKAQNQSDKKDALGKEWEVRD
jgi:hypothetical protein